MEGSEILAMVAVAVTIFAVSRRRQRLNNKGVTTAPTEAVTDESPDVQPIQSNSGVDSLTTTGTTLAGSMLARPVIMKRVAGKVGAGLATEAVNYGFAADILHDGVCGVAGVDETDFEACKTYGGQILPTQDLSQPAWNIRDGIRDAGSSVNDTINSGIKAKLGEGVFSEVVQGVADVPVAVVSTVASAPVSIVGGLTDAVNDAFAAMGLVPDNSAKYAAAYANEHDGFVANRKQMRDANAAKDQAWRHSAESEVTDAEGKLLKSTGINRSSTKLNNKTDAEIEALLREMVDDF